MSRVDWLKSFNLNHDLNQTIKIKQIKQKSCCFRALSDVYDTFSIVVGFHIAYIVLV